MDRNFVLIGLLETGKRRAQSSRPTGTHLTFAFSSVFVITQSRFIGFNVHLLSDLVFDLGFLTV